MSDWGRYSVETLLKRKSLQLNMGPVKEKLRGKAVAVLGAAGSIGTEVCRQVLSCGIRALLCIDQNETGIFHLERDLAGAESGQELAYYVADVADSGNMQRLFQKHAPDVVFHAAAYKHVPLMERNASSAIKNNVFGFLTALGVARQSNCEAFILISSDKAVYPTSVMGATKRIGELIIGSQRSQNFRCIAVRFGNVLFSSGSLLENIRRQIRAKKPLTVTHPEAARFFMTPQEAAALLLQAFATGEPNDILVLETGETLRIMDLVRAFVHCEGMDEEEFSFEFTGLRNGEKLVEDLYYSEEEILPTSFPNIKRVRCKTGDLDINPMLEELRVATCADNLKSIHDALKKIVPQYLPYIKSSAGIS